MAALFGFGPFTTDAGALIEQATDNSASAGNLPLHLQICDVINSYENGPKDAVAAIRKRLTGNSKNFHIINLTLTVVETCVKNCGVKFHIRIAQKDFLKDLTNVIQPKNTPPTNVRDRILGLIQYWADAFKSNPELSAVSEVYEQLKSEGVEFPPLDLDTFAPINTPRRSENETRPSQPTQQQAPAGTSSGGGRSPSQRPIGNLKPEQIAKLLSELDVVRRNLDVMNEILVENAPGNESEDDFTLMQELNTTLRAMQERVTQLIGRVQDEIVMESLLQINDELNGCFTRYDRHMKNRKAVQQQLTGNETSFTQQPPIAEPGAPSISYPSLDDNPPPYEEGGAAVGQLIDLGFDIEAPPPLPSSTVPNTEGGSGPDIIQQLAQIGITSDPSPATVTAANTGRNILMESDKHEDEFDMFAHSRLAYSTTTEGSTYEDNLPEQGTSLASALHRQPQPEPIPANQYETLETWMATTNQGGDPPAATSQQNDQATSAEFDQFLADRATKGRHRPQMQQQEELNDQLFQL